VTAQSSQIHTPIPCLPAVPLLGNVLALRNERLALLQRISHEFGDIGAFHFGPRMVPVLNSPELIRQALVEQEANFEKTATVRHWELLCWAMASFSARARNTVVNANCSPRSSSIVMCKSMPRR
jgi:Cytochrome P450